jgi:hypothetical protein
MEVASMGVMREGISMARAPLRLEAGDDFTAERVEAALTISFCLSEVFF